MAVNVTYREANPVVPTATTIKNSPLSNQEIDGNFKAVKDAVELFNTPTGAALVGVTPVGNIAANTVQLAIEELDSEKVSSATLAAPSGSSLVGYDGGTVQDVLDGAKSLQDYAALRAYTGRATRIYITGQLVTSKPAGIAGIFQYDPTDTTSTDNGGTIIVLADGRRFKRDYTGDVNVKWFEVAGNGSADDTSKLNAAAEYCRVTSQKLVGNNNDTYKITGTFHLNCDADFSGSMVVAPASLAAPAIKTSSATVGVNLILGLDIKYPNITNERVSGVVPTVGSVGVMFEGVRNCRFEFGSIYGFETNLLLYSDNTNRYISYNQIFFTSIFAGAKINIHLKVALTGWINQCVWHGGQFAQYSSDKVSFTAVNLKITKADTGGNNPPNGHTFLGLSMEGDFSRTIQYDLNPAIVTSYFSCNVFINCRFEASVSFEFSPYALYDLFVGCNSFAQASFVNNVFPNNISTRSLRYINESAPVIGAAGSRTDKEVTYFGASNNGSAAAAAFGVQKEYFNAAITGSGYVQLFNSANAALEYPMLELNTAGSLPKIAFGDGSVAPATTIYANGSQIRTNATGVMSASDNTATLGAAGLRWSTVYAATGTINTSDERAKQDIAELDEAERRVAIAVKQLVRKYRFKDAALEKGESARIHIGVIAQDVMAAFEAEGLDPMRYGIVCYDEWQEELEIFEPVLDESGKPTGEVTIMQPYRQAGNRYGVRYEELLAFIIAAL